jgi:hypothetical protein
MMQQENGNDFVPDLITAGVALRRVRHLRQKCDTLQQKNTAL